VFTVLITGPPGVGKTSVLTALVDELTDDDVSHAAIELETLVWTHPALSDELWLRHVKTTCALYREAGHRLLLVAETLETDDDLNQLLDVLDADESFLVRLEAQPATLVERIIEREPESWSGLTDLVEHTQELAVTMPALSGVDLVLTTDAERPEAVAHRIRVALPRHLVEPASSGRLVESQRPDHGIA
jgi:DNA polymerase III delta prime subunit